MRTGARVAKMSLDKKTDEEGLLVAYDRLSGLAQVLFDSNASKVIEFDPEKLMPLVEVCTTQQFVMFFQRFKWTYPPSH